MKPEANDPSDVDIDVGALQRKYAEERDKRVRSDAVNQFQEMKGELAHFAHDPNADPDFTRASVVEDTDVLIVGGGFGGLLAAVRLRERGIRDLRIIELGGDFGGTWYWNRYPGAACDVESYMYMPMLEEMGYLPTEKYAHAPEIRDYCRLIGRRYKLYRAALFQTKVEELRWDEKQARWLTSTNRGDRINARFVISATGLLSSPKLPGIPGIEGFQGHSFHTSRWDYSYTGGDEGGAMAGLSDKVVGVIGTGSTGIQVIPKLSKSAKHVYVFQRTPSSVDPRGNRATDPEWARSLEPGWQRKRMINFTSIISGIAQEEDLVNDGWTDIVRDSAVPISIKPGGDPEALRLAEMKKMEKSRRRIDAIVENSVTAEALKPYYNYFCKRPCFHDEYLQSFNRSNVTLVDTQGQGVERITANGVVVGGKTYEADCLIYATGFDFMTEYTREAGLEIYGRDSQPLSEHWSEGRRTLFGIQTHDFPNLFMVSLVQAGVAVNYVFIADAQTRYMAHVIGEAMDTGIAAIEPSVEAQDRWVDRIVTKAAGRRAFMESCTPSYFNYEGKRPKANQLNEIFVEGGITYVNLLEEWCAEGSMKGLDKRGPIEN